MLFLKRIAMGLTHTWRRPTELPATAFNAAVADARKILGQAGIPLAGFDGTGSPILESNHIVFNGANGACCEPFEIRQIEFDRRGRPQVTSFCKTQGLPYDLAVKAVLIILKAHLGPDFKVMSDETNERWERASALVTQSLNLQTRFELDNE
jgi:hypothetical protein